MTTPRGGRRSRPTTTADATPVARRRRRAGATTAVAALLGALAFSGSAALPVGVADAAPPDLLPPAAGILPGPAAGGDTPGSWGPCVPDPESDDSCTGWQWPPATAGSQGTDNAPNVIVGGDFTATDGAAESEGLHVVQGDALFERRPYNVGVVGVGSLVTPADRADMLVVGGDLTVANPSVNQAPEPANVIVGSSIAPYRTGTIRVGGAHQFRDPSYDASSSPFGQLGTVDSAHQDPPTQFQNQLFDDVGVIDTDHYTDLFGGTGKMARYSQQCYAELSTTSATSVVNAGGTLGLEHGTFTQTGDDVTLTSDGSGDLVVFDLPATLGSGTTGVQVDITGVADGATVLINTLAEGPVRQVVGSVTWNGGETSLQDVRSILWNYPFSTDLTLGGGAQLPGSLLVGSASSTLDQSYSGVNGRTYTPGDLVHSNTLGGSGKEFHAYPFDGALGCVQTTSGTFAVSKALDGDGASAVPDGTTFTVGWEVTGPAGSPNLGRTGTLEVEADGAAVTGPSDLAEGDEVTLSEPTFPGVDDVGWGDPVISPNPVMIGVTGTVVDVSVTNTATLQRGGFTVTKEVAGDHGASTTEFTGTWTCSAPNTDGDASGTWSLADGEELALDGFPAGTTCEVTEDEINDANGTWESTIAPAGELTITDGEASAQVVTVTNTFTSTVGAFTITKEVAGGEGGTVDEFTVDWVCTAPDGTQTGGTVTLAGGETSDPIGGLPVGTTCAISEPEVDDPAGTWVADITPDEITIGSEDPTDVAAVTVTNTFSTEPVGGFTVTKVVDGDASAATVREFSGTWTCSAENLAGDASGAWSLAGGGSVVVDGFPVGTTCDVAEDDVSDDAGTWASSIAPAGELTVTEDGAGATVVTVTNTFTPTVPSPSPSPSESTPAPSLSDSTPAPSTPTPSSSTTAPRPDTGTGGGTGSGDDGTLPRTGAQVATAVALAALLVGGGTLALLAARRRRG
ncbi:DUF5979 domain-containing protein [Isoptericola variabilis]|uniref:DUF5979 domain-containing protein n=1 Tax=Isoptericola variabilis TaxID=139208 RepID=UPI003D24B80F